MSFSQSFRTTSHLESHENLQDISRTRTINSNISQNKSDGRITANQQRWYYNRSMLAYSQLTPNVNNSVLTEDHLASGYIWGTKFNIDEGKKKIEKFLLEFNQNAILKDNNDMSLYLRKMQQIKETDVYYILVDAQDIYNFEKKLYYYLTKYPAETVLLFDQMVNKIYFNMFVEQSKRENFDKIINTRIVNLKDQNRIRDLNPSDINHLISLKGIVIRTSSIFPEMKEAYFKCSICGSRKQVIIERGRANEPTKCDKCETKGIFEIVYNSCSYADKQYIKLQEKPDEVPEGETPVSVNLIVYDDLVDECKPGDLLEVIGIYRAQPVRLSTYKKQLKSIFHTYIDVISIIYDHKNKVVLNNENCEINSKMNFTQKQVKLFQEFANKPSLYDDLVKSFSPSLYELDSVKIGLLCQLFGGSPKHFDETQRGRFRSEINILLIGDPSTAKSQLLTFQHSLSPRGIYTSGKGSTTVGLTAYISRDPETKEIILESGALVLSDKGICCIDEFDKMNEGTQSILHEVMEQQTISIAKNGIVCSLNARTAILAAANPRESKYNPQKSIVYNLSLSPSLLSRFDLIYLMLDKQNEKQDRLLGQHIVNLFSPEMQEQQNNTYGIVSQEFLTKYITYARNYCFPKITDKAEQTLIQAYMEMRQMGLSRNIITATPRQLESLIRLSEAHAKMRLSDFVQEQDVRIAVDLIKNATQQAAIDPVTGQIDMNIISTGYSSSVVKKINIIARCLKTLMIQQEEKFIRGYHSEQIMEELNCFYEQEIGDFNPMEVLKACKALEEENFLMVLGNTDNFKYYVKKYII